ncbi:MULTISPECIES: GntR family transcriptional regulator [Paenibacillus]|uniref:Transcriptional regulator n=1 Tax=Paenibacillus rhizosphaerae TaxID=297318 RepID=A0A1R1EU92_9BACL|nr:MULTISPECIES: GntR family transcriptional regulator [Paenibacillus]OMF55348.1 transcriptional regulator [Paenibacillus rhizosphaerae]OXL85009.1 transcriptional regulator [Paenibacillus sp. SSG-1]UYO07293.1 GntR family transcriptional regulator [Paenibacillus sp. PSB04]
MHDEMEIMDKLIADMEAGIYEPDDKLPSENDLARLFKVPRMTARKAYEKLQDLGYVYSRQGKGSFVRDQHQRIPLLFSGNESFSRKMIHMGYDYQSRNIFCDPIEYNHKVYKALEAQPEEKVYRIGRLRLIDNRPIAIHTSYVAESMFPDIGRTGRDITSMFDFYRGKGYTGFESMKTLLSVTYPGRKERELLACTSLIPLLVVETGCLDSQTNKPLEYTRIMYRSDYFTYEL